MSYILETFRPGGGSAPERARIPHFSQLTIWYMALFKLIIPFTFNAFMISSIYTSGRIIVQHYKPPSLSFSECCAESFCYAARLAAAAACASYRIELATSCASHSNPRSHASAS